MPVRDHHLRVALVHDDLTQRGGAERVVLALHRLFPDAPIYTSVFSPETTYPEFGGCDVRTSPLQALLGVARRHRALLPLYPWAFGRLRLADYDLVISSSSRFAHGVRVEGGTHLCYCHAPPRFLYGREYFGEGGPVPAWARPALAPVLAALRRWDRRAARRPDAYIANSAEVAGRIERLYGRPATVIRPPVAEERFGEAIPACLPLGGPLGPGRLPYYLVVSRLLPYKRVELAIRACEVAGARLVIVGSGPAEGMLRRMAGPLSRSEGRSGPVVEFVPWASDGVLNGLLQGCTALLQPGQEDFGLMPLEANAAGRPAIALATAGALETVIDGYNGVHFAAPTVPALVKAMERAASLRWDPTLLRHHARNHAEHRFHADVLQLLSDRGILPATRSATAS